MSEKIETTGIIEIRFNDFTDEEIQDFIGAFYIKNTDKIKGMEYIQFDNKDTLIDIHRTIRTRIKELENRRPRREKGKNE